jgi:TldD protein
VGYAYTEQFDPDSMRRAAGTSAKIATGSTERTVPQKATPIGTPADRYLVDEYSLDEPAASVLAMLHGADEAARAVAPSTTNAEARLIVQGREIAIATSDGHLVGASKPLIKCRILAHWTRGSYRQIGIDGKALRSDLELVASGDPGAESISRRAAERAALGHDAVDAPAGFLPAVLAAGHS